MTAVLAMLFMVLAATLAVGMFAMATMNIQSGRSLSDAERARGLAESGSLDELAVHHDEPPEDDDRRHPPTVADSLWPAIRTSVSNDLAEHGERVGTGDDVRRRHV